MKINIVRIIFLTGLIVNSILAQAAFAAISGTVFIDTVANGLSGIHVTTTDISGVTKTDTTDNNGFWLIDMPNVQASDDIRVEFSNIPNYLGPDPDAGNSNTLVQFVKNNTETVDLELAYSMNLSLGASSARLIDPADFIVTAFTDKSTYPAISAFNGAGLSGDLHNNTLANMWFSYGYNIVGKWIKVDLGAVYELDHLKVWNFNTHLTNRGIQQADIYVALSDPNINRNNKKGPFKSQGWTLVLENQQFAQSPGSNALAATNEFIPLSGVEARYLAIRIDANFNAQGHVGLSEVQVFKVGDVSSNDYALTVNNGTGDGNYTAGTSVSLTADPAATGQIFDRWTGATSTIADINLAQSNLIMPAADISVTASYRNIEPTAYSLTVNNGTGSGDYSSGATVNITANPAPVDQEFDLWTGAIANVANVNAASTTLSMPSANTVISASYRNVNPSTYSLIVNNGSGDGSYSAGAVVTINANAAPAGQEFDQWTGAVANVANVNSTTTTLSMPSANTSITATYRNVSPASYLLTVNNGSGDGSHAAGASVSITANAPPSGQVFDKWTGAISSIADVNASTTNLTMPASNTTVSASFRDITTGYRTFDQVPYVVAQEVSRFADLLNQGHNRVVRMALFGDSQETAPGGGGEVYMPRLNYEAFLYYGNSPETLIEPSKSVTRAWMMRSSAPSTVGLGTQGLPDTRVATIKDTNNSKTFIAQLLNSAENAGPDAFLPGENQAFFDTSADFKAQIFTLSESGSSKIYWEAKPHGALSLSKTVATTNAGALNLSHSGGGNKIVSGFTDTLDMNGQQYMQLKISADTGGTSKLAAMRFINETHNYGLVINDFSVGGYQNKHFIDNHYDAGDMYRAFEFDAAILHMGANDAGHLKTPEDFDVETRQVISIIRGWMNDPNYKIILMGDPDLKSWGLNNQRRDRFAQFPGVQESIALSDPNVLVINSRRLADDLLDWRFGHSKLDDYLSDIVHYAPEGGRALAKVEMDALLGIIGPITHYDLLVNNGTGDGSYSVGTIVSISADSAPAGHEFDQWTGAIASISNINAANTNIVMPTANANITASYRPITAGIYTLTVGNGSGDGEFEPGISIEISADPAPTGQEFDQWTGAINTITNINAADTTLIMPSADATVTATYRDIPPDSYFLTVNNGSGDDGYVAGATANISADVAPAGQAFDQWTGATSTVADIYAADTSLVMPAADTSITATYRNISSNVQLIDSANFTVTAFSNKSSYPAIDAFNGAGLTNDTHNSKRGDMWFSYGYKADGKWIKVDLGAVYTLDHLRLWNYNYGSRTDHGIRQADIYVALTDPSNNLNNKKQPFKPQGWTLVAENQLLGRSPGGAAILPTNERISLGGVQARYLVIRVDDNFSAAQHVGLSEVQIYGAQ